MIGNFDDLTTYLSRFIHPKFCYHLEFASSDANDIKKLREIIGKHVYISSVEENGKEIEKLIIS